ncbi:MAG: MBL fold metallo-hydrolase [Lachnospiraceae bacterium]|nr:MBL fold metallo-hydrolase [Lachnospiraceae bacterium]
MNEFDFYKREQLADNLWVVTESYGVNSTFQIYVLTGADRTVVIDSGLGAQSGLRRYIETYIGGAGKPMSVLLTHTHPDHVGGAPLFDEVYVNPKEFPDLDWNRCHYRRFGDLEWFCGHSRWMEEPDADIMNFCYLHFVRDLLQEEDCIPVNDGDILDFGSIRLTAIHCPSHSAGSTIYYWKEENIAFVGDAIQHWNGYPGKEKGPAHFEAVKRFISMMPEDVHIMNAHDPGVFGMDFARNVLQCYAEIIEGKDLDKDNRIGYSNHFHVTRHKPGQNIQMDHYVNDVRLSYNLLDH